MRVLGQNSVKGLGMASLTLHPRQLWVGNANFGFKATVALMPVHSVYIESHLSGGAIMTRKPATQRKIGIDADAAAIIRLNWCADAWCRNSNATTVITVCVAFTCSETRNASRRRTVAAGRSGCVRCCLTSAKTSEMLNKMLSAAHFEEVSSKCAAILDEGRAKLSERPPRKGKRGRIYPMAKVR